MSATITKTDLVNLGYGNSFSSDIIRRSKWFMVQSGFPYYESKRLGRVPVHAVEHILGYSISLDTGSN